MLSESGCKFSNFIDWPIEIIEYDGIYENIGMFSKQTCCKMDTELGYTPSDLTSSINIFSDIYDRIYGIEVPNNKKIDIFGLMKYFNSMDIIMDYFDSGYVDLLENDSFVDT